MVFAQRLVPRWFAHEKHWNIDEIGREACLERGIKMNANQLEDAVASFHQRREYARHDEDRTGRVDGRWLEAKHN